MPKDRRQQKQAGDHTTQILTNKMLTTSRGSSRSATSNHKENNEHNNNIVDINYNSLNSQRNRLHMNSNGKHHLQLPDGSDGSEDSLERNFPKTPQPYFELSVPRNITARAGQIAAINCRVENLGDKSVSRQPQSNCGFWP